MNYTAIWLLRLIVPEICAEFRDLRCMFVCKAWYTMIREYMIAEGLKIKSDLFGKTQYISLFLLRFARLGKLPNMVKHGWICETKYDAIGKYEIVYNFYHYYNLGKFVKTDTQKHYIKIDSSFDEFDYYSNI